MNIKNGGVKIIPYDSTESNGSSNGLVIGGTVSTSACA